MRVVHTITKGDVGGAQTHVVELAIAQAGIGHEVTVIAGSDGPAMDRIRAQRIDVSIIDDIEHSVSLPHDRAAVARLRAEFRELSPTVVHGHSSKGGLLSRLAASREGIPSVYTAHGFPFQAGAPWRQRLLSFAGEFVGARFGDAIICLTEEEAELARRAHLARSRAIHVVSNGLPDTGPRRRPPTGRVAPAMIMVARFAAPKRQRELVEVLGGLLDLEWTMTFVGDGPQLEETRDVAAPTLGDRVTFLGHRDDVADLVAASDIALLWSGYEGMPIALMEAMRAGLACVGSDLPGVRRLFGIAPDRATGDGRRAGGLVAASTGDLRSALAEILVDPAMIDELGRSARRRWEDSFTMAEMVERIDAVYASVI